MSEMMVTAKMASVGASWVDINAQAEHVLHLLTSKGEAALGLVSGILRLIKLATERDMIGVFVELNKDNVVIQDLIQAVKDEFGV